MTTKPTHRPTPCCVACQESEHFDNCVCHDETVRRLRYLTQMLEHVESCLKNKMPINIGDIQQAIAIAEGK